MASYLDPTNLFTLEKGTLNAHAILNTNFRTINNLFNLLACQIKLPCTTVHNQFAVVDSSLEPASYPNLAVAIATTSSSAVADMVNYAFMALISHANLSLVTHSLVYLHPGGTFACYAPGTTTQILGVALKSNLLLFNPVYAWYEP